MIYVIEGNEDLGYYDSEDVRDTRHGLVVVDSDGEWIGHAVEATCSICGGQVPSDAAYALCELHEGSSREGGRADAWQSRYERDVGGRGR